MTSEGQTSIVPMAEIGSISGISVNRLIGVVKNGNQKMIELDDLPSVRTRRNALYEKIIQCVCNALWALNYRLVTGLAVCSTIH